MALCIFTELNRHEDHSQIRKDYPLALPSVLSLSDIVNNLFELAEGKEIREISLESNANM